MPEISIVMSVFNAETFLVDSIRSILNQTYADFEFIIINDGSTDRSEGIIKTFAAQDARILMISRENKGLARSLNEGIALARGKYIARMDADDISVPARLSLQLSAIARLNVDVLGGSIKYMGGAMDGRVEEYPLSDADVKFRMLLRSPLAHPTILAETAVLRTNAYNADAIRGQDYELWTRLALGGARFANVRDVCVLYRTPAPQTVRGHTEKQFEVSLKASVTYAERMYGLSPQLMRTLRTALREESVRSEDVITCSVVLARIGSDHGVTAAWVERTLFGIARRACSGGLALLRARGRIVAANPQAMSLRLTVLYLLKVFPFSNSRTLIRALKWWQERSREWFRTRQ